MELSELFEKAVRESRELPVKPGNDVLLKLYALYKQSTEGDNQLSGPENPFDFVGRAKHEAWSEMKGMTKEAAMKEYVELVNSLKG